MAYSLSNKCAKNLCKRAVLVQLIIKNVVTCFLEHKCRMQLLALITTTTINRRALCAVTYKNSPQKWNKNQLKVTIDTKS